MYLFIDNIIFRDNSLYLFNASLFSSTDENKEALNKYKEFWDGVKNEIEPINNGKAGEYDEDFMKIKF